MKTGKFFLVFVLLCKMLSLHAQSPAGASENPLLGTWIRETDREREIKIITPTHFAFVIEDIKTDKFLYIGIGTYILAGGFYRENIEFSNIANASIANPVYEFTVDGDTFYQKGTLVLSGNKTQLNHVFKKAKTAVQNSNNSGIGTWRQLSSSVEKDNKNRTASMVADSSIYVITPTHWMWIGFGSAKKLNNVMAGTYTLEGNKSMLKVEHGISAQGQTFEYSQRVEGDNLYRTSLVKSPNSGPKQADEVFQRVYGK
ncbi:hypothetical protein GXP67_02490 [Rhodocytophaga rosea]|uniref:Lipocalin-like domain-containing protein n=1 Tax=Rhodocytophaga rosea TaxID=2704465 RepID=A0A6C0GD38_9BACT|nr:hypothetical protein [Rhodocytophaga rosea]QHT65610.1 hypothetical protein GXP67_02490 [Rhodocytophaga rosea]